MARNSKLDVWCISNTLLLVRLREERVKDDERTKVVMDKVQLQQGSTLPCVLMGY